MSAKHTPGPWEIGMRGGLILARSRTVQVANLVCSNANFRPDQKALEANARLIAAAPDYDAAARNLARFKDAGEDIPDEAWQQLYDAIAKAGAA